MFDVLISNGRVVDGSGLPWRHADVGVRGDRIAAVGRLAGAEAALRLDATNFVVAPGFIDAHVHGDLVLLSDPLHEPAIRQGVTTYVLGQDGVAFAPGSAATLDYVRRYTAGFSGSPRPGVSWSTVAEYLACFDRTTAVNVCTLIPNGNLRHEVMGLARRPPTAGELEQMCRMVRDGMEHGAVGLSSGLDYIPSRHAADEELAALCAAMAPFGGVYVTHMRRYDPEGVLGSLKDVYAIGRAGGVPVHVSHFNSRADLVLPSIDAARAAGTDVTYDLYCYLAASTILGMIALPPELQEAGVEASVQLLGDPAVRDELRPVMNRESDHRHRAPDLSGVRLGYVRSPAFSAYEGRTLGEAAALAGQDLTDFVCDVLIASEMAVCCVAPHANRTQEDVRQLIRHPAMMGGSDGIFTGTHPHPRGCGCFARYIGYHVRGDHTWAIEQAVQHLSAAAATRFGLSDRGLLRPGYAADVIVFDPETVGDHATYDHGTRLATGMVHVLVNGEPVLVDGARTALTPGRGLRRG